MAREWQTFARKFEDMKEGTLRLFIKDLTPGARKYDTRFVEAIVRKSKEALPEGDLLYYRSESGIRISEPWYIQIVKDLPPWVPGKPWDDVFEAIVRHPNGDELPPSKTPVV